MPAYDLRDAQRLLDEDEEDRAVPESYEERFEEDYDNILDDYKRHSAELEYIDSMFGQLRD